jgi:RNA polymerase sigma-70 factor, ECF subfamily
MKHTCHRQFEQAALPHPDAACNLTRWLAGNGREAENVTHCACLRAFKFFGFRDGEAQSWLLPIVRDTASTLLRRNGEHDEALEFDQLTQPDRGGP